MKKPIISFAFTLKLLYRFVFILSVLGLFVFIIDYGFDQSSSVQQELNAGYFILVILGVFTSVLRYTLREKLIKRSVLIFDIISITITLAVLYVHFFSEEAHHQLTFLYNDNWLKFVIILTFIREFSEQNINFKRTVLNPAQLFIISFLSIIFLGAVLLMLPKATYTDISFLDSLFTSTSAVCVTGLAVVDTGSYFTLFLKVDLPMKINLH